MLNRDLYRLQIYTLHDKVASILVVNRSLVDSDLPLFLFHRIVLLIFVNPDLTVAQMARCRAATACCPFSYYISTACAVLLLLASIIMMIVAAPSRSRVAAIMMMMIIVLRVIVVVVVIIPTGACTALPAVLSLMIKMRLMLLMQRFTIVTVDVYVGSCSCMVATSGC